MKMKTNLKLALLVAGGMFLAGCSEPLPPEQWKQSEVSLKSVPGLEDCLYVSFQMRTNRDATQVIRCPNSETTTAYRVPRGKTSVQLQTTVVDQTDPADVARKAKLKQLDDMIKAQQEQIAKLREELMK